MPKISITAEDLKKLTVMEAGWRAVKVKSVTYDPSKDRNSMNYKITFETENEPGDIRELTIFVNHGKNLVMFHKSLLKIYTALFDHEVKEGEAIDMEPETWIGMGCWGEVIQKINELNSETMNDIGRLSPTSKVPF